MGMMKIVTNSPEQTIDVAKSIGARLKGGECIELTSDVGGGKTTFVRGLVSGAGSTDHVSSPTFTIS
jgi:tRNA threonylcarbamoyladenosine biosynthesis protein TsaE